MRHDISLRSGAATLAPLLPEHVTPTYVAWLNDPAVVGKTEQRYAAHTVESVRRYVEGTLDAPDAMIWRILVEARHVGNIRLSSINRQHLRAAVALVIGNKSLHGRGIGTAAIAALATYALGPMGLHKLTAGIYSTNPGSRRAFEKAGFRHEATLREHVREDDRFIDVWEFARFAS